MSCRGEELLHEGSATIDGFLNHFHRARDEIGARIPRLEQGGVVEDDGKDIVKIVRDAAGQRAEAFHLLRLDELLLEAFPLGIVKKINLEIAQVSLRIALPDKARGDVDGFAPRLPHLKLRAFNGAFQSHRLADFRPVPATAKKRREIRGQRILGRFETKRAGEGRVAGENRAVGANDEVAGQILVHEATVTFFASAQLAFRVFMGADVRVNLETPALGVCRGHRPMAGHAKRGAIAALLFQLSFPMSILQKALLDHAQRLEKLSLKESVHICPQCFLVRPAVGSLGPAIPVGDRALAIGEEDAVLREIEQLGLDVEMLARESELGASLRFPHRPRHDRSEMTQMLFKDKISRAGVERFDRLGLIECV